MASLGDLWRTAIPAARPAWAVPDAALAADVAWVRVLRARVPALEALDPGDLVLAPAGALVAVAPDAPGAEALAEAITGAAASAVLLVGEAVDPGLPPWAALVTAAAARGLPVLVVAGADVPALERSLIGWLVNRRAEIERQAAALERWLEQLALGGADLRELIAAVGGFLGRAAVLEGRRGNALAIHAPDEPAAAAAASRYLAGSGAIALRISLPIAPLDAARRLDLVRYGEPPLRGSLVLLGDAPVGELERIACDRVAALLALELARDAAVQRARETARHSEALPADGPPWVVVVARQAGAEDVENAEQRETLRAELRMLAPHRRLALRGDSESLELRLVAVADADDPLGLAIAGRIAGFLRRTVAVSRPFSDPAGRPAAEAEARATLEAGALVVAAPPVVRADRLPAYRLLGSLPNLPDGERLARTLLAPLLAGRPALVAERLATLRAVLDRAGPAEAAAALGVHRNTVAYRVRRIESLAGWDLRDPELRLALAVAARIVQREQEETGFATS